MDNKKLVYNGFIKIFREGHFEIAQVTDSVAILIYDNSTQQIVLIKQQRYPMKSNANPQGYLLEVPAGRRDINCTVKQLIVKEVEEEVGIKITENNILLLNNGIPLALSPGVLTEKMFLAYVEVDSSQIEKEERQFGNVNENEKIQRVFMSINELSGMVFEDMKTFLLVKWFLFNRMPKIN